MNFSADSLLYYTLGIESALKFLDINDKPIIDLDFENYIVNYGPLKIPMASGPNAFHINYFGPVSARFNTFNRYPLSNVLDTKDYTIGISSYDSDLDEFVFLEDIDWMDMYIDNEHPAYEFFKPQNPFRGKIVVIGTSLAEDQDIKETPYYNYDNNKYFMPGLEVHANAIQQILHNNHLPIV